MMKKLRLWALSALCFAGLALAEAPVQKNQAPGFYKMNLAGFQVTALFDGALNINTKLLSNISAGKIPPLLDRMFVQGPEVQTAVNAYLIHTGNKLVLVDAGVGASTLFGPNLGKTVENLKAAGYSAENVDVVLLTHLHPDHMNGIITGDGKMAFPNAEVWSSKADNDFWLSDEVAAKMPKEIQGLFKMAKDVAAPYQASGRWKVFTGDQALMPGVHGMAATGHTPGHTAFVIESEGKKLLIWGDVVHNHAVQFAHPEVALEFDADKKQAVVTRKKLFQKAAAEKILVAGMHLPFPGIGHVRKDQKGYSWVPVEFSVEP